MIHSEKSSIKDDLAKETDLKTISSYFPIISLTVIMLGLLRQLIYYSNFEVPIKYFLGLSELGLIISDDLLYTICLMIFYWIITLFQKEKPNEGFNKEHSILERFSLRIKIVGIIFLIIIFVGSFFTSLYSDKIVFAIPVITIISKRDNYKLLGSFITLPLLKGLLFGLAFFILMTAFTIKAVEGGRYKNTLIKTDDSTYVSTDDSYFIGKTEKYVFIFNKKDSTSIIISSDKIKKIVLRERPLFFK
jgi:hypothetical protein